MPYVSVITCIRWDLAWPLGDFVAKFSHSQFAKFRYNAFCHEILHISFNGSKLAEYYQVILSELKRFYLSVYSVYNYDRELLKSSTDVERKKKWLLCPVTLRKDQNKWVDENIDEFPKTLMRAWEKTLYCESYQGKKAVANVRAGIKHPTWSFKEQLI